MAGPFKMPQPLTTRDGTLNADSQMVNFFFEQDTDGKWQATLRPGSTVAMSTSKWGTSAASAQGLFSYGNHVFSITQQGGNDVVASVTDSYALQTLTAATSPLARYTCLSSIYTTAGNWLTVLQEPLNLYVQSAATTIVKNTASGYPGVTVKGLGYLDGSWYVMTPYGAIMGSDIDNPLSWNALNLIYTDRGIGAGVSIIRHLNYIVAFCDNGIQFFYDAGNPYPASALSALPNGTYNMGCVAAVSIAQVEQVTVFLGKTQQKGRSIYVLSGLSVQKISDAYIDKIIDLSNLSVIYAWGIRIQGHSHYLISFGDLGITLDYDFTTGKWSVWAGTNGTGIYNGGYYLNPPLTSGLLPIGDYVQGANDGYVYLLDGTLATDAGAAITGTIQTEPIGNGQARERCGIMQLVADTVNANVAVSYSDNDYQTWSNPANINLSFQKKQLVSLGSFRQRSFRFTYSGGVPCRFKEYFLGKAEDKGQPA